MNKPQSVPLPDTTSNNQMLTGTGLLLALLGIIGVLNTTAISQGATNWWANFVFAPMVVLFVTSWLLWNIPRLRLGAYAALGSGVTVATVAMLLLFNAMGFGWALLIAVPGLIVTALSSASLREVRTPAAGAWLRTIRWWGGIAAATGVLFLLGGVLPLAQLVGGFQWWSVIILAAGAAAIWQAWQLYRVERHLTTSGIVLASFGALTVLEAGLEAFQIF